MIGIVIVAHGRLAHEYRLAVEHVLGPQDNIHAIMIESDFDPEVKQHQICEAADAVDQGDGVVIVTDLFGASPANLSQCACCADNRRMIHGANLPLLLQLAKSRTCDVHRAVDLACEAAHRYIKQ